MQSNGNPGPPEVGPNDMIIRYDPERQVAVAVFNPAAYKTWGFVAAVLEMAKCHAETAYKMAISQDIQARQMMAAQDQKIARQIIQGN